MKAIKIKLIAVMAMMLLALPMAAVINKNEASAAVTNCYVNISSGAWPQRYLARCDSTNGNPPYTTQFRLVVRCSKGPATPASTTVWGAWRTAGSGENSVAQCTPTYNFVKSYYLEFR